MHARLVRLAPRPERPRRFGFEKREALQRRGRIREGLHEVAMSLSEPLQQLLIRRPGRFELWERIEWSRTRFTDDGPRPPMDPTDVSHQVAHRPARAGGYRRVKPRP